MVLAWVKIENLDLAPNVSKTMCFLKLFSEGWLIDFMNVSAFEHHLDCYFWYLLL